MSEICPKVPPVASDLTISPATLPTLMDRLHEVQTVFQKTGGTHAVALACPRQGLHPRRGRGAPQRHGQGHRPGRPHPPGPQRVGGPAVRPHQLRNGPEMCQGRHPHSGRGPAPTSMALELARELNLTTVGFMRNQRLNIYTAPGTGDGGGNLRPYPIRSQKTIKIYVILNGAMRSEESRRLYRGEILQA